METFAVVATAGVELDGFAEIWTVLLGMVTIVALPYSRQTGRYNASLKSNFGPILIAEPS